MKWRFALFIAFLVITLDQLSKFFAGDHVQINRGISFQWFAALHPVVMVIVLLIIIIEIGWMGRKFWESRQLAAGMLLGGAVSNIVDRLLVGGVKDWWYLPFLEIHNNLADWAIGGALIILVVEEGVRYVRRRNTV